MVDQQSLRLHLKKLDDLNKTKYIKLPVSAGKLTPEKVPVVSPSEYVKE